MGAGRVRAPMEAGVPLSLGVGRRGEGGAVGVPVSEEVQARAEPEAGPSTLAIVVFFHLKPPHYLVMLSARGRASRRGPHRLVAGGAPGVILGGGGCGCGLVFGS